MQSQVWLMRGQSPKLGSGCLDLRGKEQAGQWLFRPQREGTISRKGKTTFHHCEQVWSRISFSKANSFILK